MGGGSRNQCCYLQVLGLGCDTGDTLPSVLLFFDNERYLFNIGEGFQKFTLENKIKSAKLDGIFLTRTTTEAAGGLPGMLLTLADKVFSGNRELSSYKKGGGNFGADFSHTRESFLSVYGPKGMNAFTNCLRTYVNVRDIKLKVKEIGEEEEEAGAQSNGSSGYIGSGSGSSNEGMMFRKHTLVKNSIVEISSVVVDAEENEGEEGEEERYAHADKRQRTDAAEDANGSASASGRQSSSEKDIDVQVTVSMYVVDLCDIPGKFLPKKAIELGVPKGPAFGKLCRGESVMSSYGNFVAPHEVMEASTPGPTTVILDLPTVKHLKSLGRKGVVEHFVSEAKEKESKKIVVIHLSPSEVLNSEEFPKFLSKWPGCTEHIVVRDKDSVNQSIFSSATRLQSELHELHPDFFPLHETSGSSAIQSEKSLLATAAADGVIRGINLLKYHLRPMSKYGSDKSETIIGESCAAEKKRTVVQNLEEKKLHLMTNVITTDNVSKPACVSEASETELEVTFLGTGSAIPSKYRNLSGIYCHLFERGGILLDCGEGACGQLVRRYGANFEAVMTNLKLVWISHIHADHHSGLPSLLRMQNKITKGSGEPLIVVGPRPLRRVLDMYSKIQFVPIDFIDCRQTVSGISGAASAAPGSLGARLDSLGISSLRSVEVIHSCYNCFGVVIEGKQGWKLSYSGDTIPCDAFVKAALGSTIFIHEATFENGLLEEAKAKKHSLAGEAIESGRRANAYRTILTHFSQRYPKIPVIDESYTTSTCIAFDLMTFNLCNIEQLPRVVPDVAFQFESDPPAE